MEAIILAGGQGTRLKSLVNDRPKVLADINGRPFIEYLMDMLIDNGCKHFIISIGYMKEKIKSHFKEVYHNVPITYSEEKMPLGTGGAIVKALNFLKTNEPCICINGDTIFKIHIDDFFHFHLKNKSDLTIALFQSQENNRYGKIKIFDNKLINIDFRERAMINDYANGGFYIFSKSITKFLNSETVKFSFEDVFLPNALANGAKIYGFKSSGQFIDIGIPSDYLKFIEINSTYDE